MIGSDVMMLIGLEDGDQKTNFSQTKISNESVSFFLEPKNKEFILLIGILVF